MWWHTSRTDARQPRSTPDSGEAVAWSAACRSNSHRKIIKGKRCKHDNQKRSLISTATLSPSKPRDLSTRENLYLNCRNQSCTYYAKRTTLIWEHYSGSGLLWTGTNLYQFNIPLPAKPLSFTEGMMMQTRLFITSPIWRENTYVRKVYNSLWSRTSYRVEHLLCNKFTHPVHWWFLHTWLMYKRTQVAFPWKFYTYLRKFKISSYKNTQRSCLLRFKATIPTYKQHCSWALMTHIYFCASIYHSYVKFNLKVAWQANFIPGDLWNTHSNQWSLAW